jgi:hypothetical protein
VRHLLAAGRGAIRREKFASDVEQVADDIAAQLKPLIAGRRFPDDFLPSGAATTQVTLGNAPLTVSAELMLDRRHVSVKAAGRVVFDALLEGSTGELFIRAIEAGQRRFNIPDDDDLAGQALIALDQLVTVLSAKLDDLSSAAGTSVQTSLREKVEPRINFPLARLQRPLPASLTESL